MPTSYDNAKFSERFHQEYEKARKNIFKPNILVLGGTGAGKSSLINMVFGKPLANVGAGKPVTSGIQCYEDATVRIYDSEGYESGEDAQERYRSNILDFIQREESDLPKRVHMAWYCISLANHRVFDIDIKTVNGIIATGKPVAIILTQADQVSEDDSKTMMAVVKEGCPRAEVFETSTDTSLGLGAQRLIHWAHEHLDEALREGFISASKAAVPQKRSLSVSVILQHTTSAAIIAASPIPFSDAPLLIGNQIAMVARLASIWDLPALKSITGSSLLGQAISQLGRSLVGNLLKFIPSGGSLAGGAINAGVASTLTAAIGYALLEICERMTDDELEGINKDFADYFNQDVLTDLIKRKYQENS